MIGHASISLRAVSISLCAVSISLRAVSVVSVALFFCEIVYSRENKY